MSRRESLRASRAEMEVARELRDRQTSSRMPRMAGSSSAASRAHSSTQSHTPLMTHWQLVHCRSFERFRLVMAGKW